VIKTVHSISAVITANKGKDNAQGNNAKQVELPGDSWSWYSISNL